MERGFSIYFVTILALFILISVNAFPFNSIQNDQSLPYIPNLEAQIFIPASNPNIVYSGRYNFSDINFPTYSWSGCTINATFTRTSIAAALNDASNYYTIYIDGNFALTLIPNGNNVYQLAQNLPSGNHQVSIFKRTEALFGSYAFGGFYI